VWFLQTLAAEAGGRAWTVDASGDLRRPFLEALSEFHSRRPRAIVQLPSTRLM
jgi:hypothetical protein